MKNIPVKVIKPLLIATTYRINICKGLPNNQQYLFFIEKIRVLDRWDAFHENILSELEAADKMKRDYISITNDKVSKLAYYFNLMAKYFSSFNDEQDKPYLGGVSHFMIQYAKYKKPLGSKQEEELFWKAFPK